MNKTKVRPFNPDVHDNVTSHTTETPLRFPISDGNGDE